MNNYNHLDLDKVKDLVCQYTSIKQASGYIQNEEIIFNPLVIKSKLKDSEEALNLLKKDFNLSFDGIIDVGDILVKASKDICLDGYELASVLTFSNHCLRIKNRMSSLDDDLNIKGYSESLFIDENLIKRIDKVVDINGNIKEDASPKLKSIFESINRNSDRIRSACATFVTRHSSSLQENNVFTRNDRIVFLLKNSDKHKFKGFQYGTSASGLATYVEHEEFVELNNRTLALENEKLEEVNRLPHRLRSLYTQ